MQYTDAAGNEVSWLDALGQMGFGTKTSGTTTPNMGADGLTTDQWIEESSPRSANIASNELVENSSTANAFQQTQSKTIYDLFEEILKLEPGTTVNIEEAIKKYKLDDRVRQAIKSVRVVFKE